VHAIPPLHRKQHGTWRQFARMPGDHAQAFFERPLRGRVFEGSSFRTVMAPARCTSAACFNACSPDIGPAASAAGPLEQIRRGGMSSVQTGKRRSRQGV
jgi:hypothetical protein